jgi:hypothetical protein
MIAPQHTPARARYCLRVRGHLPPDWGDWFDGYTLEQTGDGATLLTSPLIDQAALYGTLSTLRDLGLALESVVPGPPTA